MHHANPEPAAMGELRSEQVTVLEDDDCEPLALGFLGGSRHEGTFRVRPVPDGSTELLAEAWLGGAVLAPGERRQLHPVLISWGAGPSELLERWAARAGEAELARTDAPYQVGWCSWYHYFHDVTEADIRHNLGLAGEWPFEVFQIDDGYQHAIGDWLDTNPKFDSSLGKLAADVAAAGFRPGIWLAPFFAGPGSRVAKDHPRWFARWVDGERHLVGMVNPGWGGITYVLDTSHPEVLAPLEATARGLVAAGFTYLKLDFLYGPTLPGRYHDPSLTPAQRLRAGLDAIRRGAGNDAFLLGCGCPLGAAVGVVDGMRIGADVAPWWDVPYDGRLPRGYEDTTPATRSAFRNTLTRSFMHRRLWLNDPDCVMLRTRETRLTPERARAWARAVGVSGGMALVSDDLELLDHRAYGLFDEVIRTGRRADDAAKAGRSPRCPDLMDTPEPQHLSADGVEL